MSRPEDSRPIPGIEGHIAGDSSAPRERNISSAQASSTALLHWRQAPAYRAFRLLRLCFFLLPLLEGLDKLFAWIYRWERFVAPQLPRLLKINAAQAVQIAGAVEIALALLVLRWPRVGASALFLWLCLGAVNLCLLPALAGLAIERLLLSLGTLALFQLATEFRRGYSAVADWQR